jgi:hypothetical protein
MVQKHRDATTLFPSCALYASFGRATCVLAQPQLPLSKFTTEPWHTTGLTLSASAVSESSWGWLVASDYLLIGQRFRPAYQSGAKMYIWGAIHVSQTRGRVITLSRLEMLQHVRRGCISTYQLCGNSFTPPQTEHSGTNADNGMASTGRPTRKCGWSSSLFPVANRIWFFQV